MSKTVPLMLQLTMADPRSLSRQLTDGIRRLIASGEIAVGAQLPSVRGLAKQLTLNPNTVAKAYGELTAEGWLDSRQGVGLFVAKQRQRLSEGERERRLSLAVEAFAAEVVGLDYSLPEILEQVEGALEPVLAKRRA